VEDFSQVTGAVRYHVLHEAAEDLLDELTGRYTVERRESKEPLAPGASLVRTIRLIPHTPEAAPLAVAFTDFPSIVLRLGRWYQQTLPSCGCDTCDEDPAELITELRLRAAALVEGGLWERIRRRAAGSWSETRLIGPGLTATQQAPLEPAAARAARRDGFAAAVQWAPWPRRAINVGGP
jgi:hypothetical protein